MAAAGSFEATASQELRVQIELERSTECSDSQWHTRHSEEKYDRYEQSFVECLTNACAGKDYVYLCNPGPKAYGMHCRRSPYNSKLWHSMIKNDKTQKWYQDVTFCYPRVGSFEVSVVKGTKRIPVFSKLTLRKWPHVEALTKKVIETVETKLGGWEPLAFLDDSAKTSVESTRHSAKMTDDELRNMIKKKFSTVIGAFRAFDKNGDGCISKAEFSKGLKSAGIDLPKNQVEQLWSIADDDGGGNLQYQEFARKFASYKASHSLHRHADFKKEGQQALIQQLHGSDAATRVAKRASIRKEDGEPLVWGVEGGESQEEQTSAQGTSSSSSRSSSKQTTSAPSSIQGISRDGAQMSLPVEEMNIDQIRAKIYKKHGSILNAFRHFDIDGDGVIDFGEFKQYLPTALGEPVSEDKLQEIWQALDPDLSGAIEMKEFVSTELFLDGRHLQTMQGLAIFKDTAKLDPVAFGRISAQPTEKVLKKDSPSDSSLSTNVDPLLKSASSASETSPLEPPQIIGGNADVPILA
ncbi:unnamed protein product [Amoebophrya sp. A120]|nr:unnamed protein product [Amoebophrya sp. A120]|eukprot:GSA120T00010384001.1